MSIPPLPVVSYDDSRNRPNVVVDGSPNAATELTLSHASRDSAGRSAAPEVVTNNHFDQDGLAGI